MGVRGQGGNEARKAGENGCQIKLKFEQCFALIVRRLFLSLCVAC